ncbi:MULTISPECIES: hypothetical protein [Tenacibaculum]|uniref:hypothetical protein n=1 Tax=Tenacibaculum TaxID=104267 RepID=UPI0021B042FB|nr:MULTISPECIES: hypothetical protein [Tenacibaculum]MCT4699702.1 hypothetical protein [Tenacibaculum haliotis]WBX70676.1 hypothetical protein PG912_10535 [Tenacibaculum retecalamus]
MKYVKGYRNCQRRKSVIFIIAGLVPISQNQLFNPTIAIINKVIPKNLLFGLLKNFDNKIIKLSVKQ